MREDRTMLDTAPHFDKATYETLVTASAYEFLRELAVSTGTEDDGELLVDSLDNLSHQDVGETVELTTPEKYPLTVREHSSTTATDELLKGAQESPESAHTIIARALYHRDVLTIAEEIVDQQSSIGRFGIRFSVNLEKFPIFPRLSEIKARGATDAKVKEVYSGTQPNEEPELDTEDIPEVTLEEPLNE